MKHTVRVVVFGGWSYLGAKYTNHGLGKIHALN